MIEIVRRQQWGARHPNGAGLAPLPATDGVFLHHSTTAARNGAQAIRDLEDIGQGRFRAGISYTFAITPDGTIYEGHGIGREGTHTKGHNPLGRAIVLIGNYERTRPTAAQLESAAQILAHGVRQRWWLTSRLRGHRNVRPTACPGDAAYATIPSIVARADELLAAPTTPPEDDMPTAAEIRTIVREEIQAETGPIRGVIEAVLEAAERVGAAFFGTGARRLRDRAAHLNPHREGR